MPLVTKGAGDLAVTEDGVEAFMVGVGLVHGCVPSPWQHLAIVASQ